MVAVGTMKLGRQKVTETTKVKGVVV